MSDKEQQESSGQNSMCTGRKKIGRRCSLVTRCESLYLAVTAFIMFNVVWGRQVCQHVLCRPWSIPWVSWCGGVCLAVVLDVSRSWKAQSMQRSISTVFSSQSCCHWLGTSLDKMCHSSFSRMVPRAILLRNAWNSLNRIVYEFCSGQGTVWTLIRSRIFGPGWNDWWRRSGRATNKNLYRQSSQLGSMLLTAKIWQPWLTLCLHIVKLWLILKAFPLVTDILYYFADCLLCFCSHRT